MARGKAREVREVRKTSLACEVKKAAWACQQFTPSRDNGAVRSLPVTPDVLDENVPREIARQGGVKPYPAHAVLINEGDEADSSTSSSAAESRSTRPTPRARKS